MIMPANIAAHHDLYLQLFLRTGIKKMMGTQRETTALRKDKSTFPCVLGLSQTKDSHLFCGFIRDVSVEKQALLGIIESKKYMETILDASFDALFVINDRGIIQMVNKSTVRVFGWTVDELVGKNINIIMPEEHARMHDSYLNSEFSTFF
jgi:PAS domain-containing protein